MRGCLSFLVFLALLAAAFTWFLLPPLAGWAVQSLLPRDQISGTLSARVSTNFPPELYTLHADAVTLTGEQVSLEGGLLDVDSLALTLHDVRLLDRTAARIDGNLAGVRVEQAGSTILAIDRVDLAGPTDAVSATVTVRTEEVRLRVVAALNAALPAPVQSLTLRAPDQVSVKVGGTTVSGRLAVRNGALVLIGSGPLPTAEVVPASATGPLHLTSLAISGPSVIVKGTLDAAGLGITAP
jgi:hypothetical protein